MAGWTSAAVVKGVPCPQEYETTLRGSVSSVLFFIICTLQWIGREQSYLAAPTHADYSPLVDLTSSTSCEFFDDTWNDCHCLWRGAYTLEEGAQLCAFLWCVGREICGGIGLAAEEVGDEDLVLAFFVGVGENVRTLGRVLVFCVE